MSEVRNDRTVTVAALKERVKEFTDARNWGGGHRPKNLAMSITIEAAELMEHFQWLDNDDYQVDRLTPEQREAIRLEVADIAIYLLSFCNQVGIDLAQAVHDKYDINEKRFPVESYRK
ncbi:nucleotide pyrophosphohydrolase [Tumebacillus permanentifrigoris]|uniref:NTP pyrophosphatase (Non-canonical NTP hydrolase) n=1 Tax=Tumebacillus permanentifrigoris TaxID=378543 RepID=A0A316D9I0_9BACL|nr:nucleotide pyrophosphohydrolase [Tumebacillus permanentifrigoris]PWK13410.1 NTP pyrophosphatase (non-canonical NTP hydrolase) [Tumebacillus permanentifrigoris]